MLYIIVSLLFAIVPGLVYNWSKEGQKFNNYIIEQVLDFNPFYVGMVLGTAIFAIVYEFVWLYFGIFTDTTWTMLFHVNNVVCVLCYAYMWILRNRLVREMVKL